MGVKHNCCQPMHFEWASVDPFGATPDVLKCNVCGRKFAECVEGEQ